MVTRHAAEYSDFVTIQNAVNSAANGDYIEIQDAVQTESGMLVNKCVTMRGSTSATIVQAAATAGTATDRVFDIPASTSVVIEDVTIRYGRTITGSLAGSGGAAVERRRQLWG